MQITESEARDIISDLRERGLINQSLVDKIDHTIRTYRLDVTIPSFGKRQNLRRTYTCPLYLGRNQGCMVSFKKKPLGCLAFNPIVKNATGLSSGCRSDQRRLSECAPDGTKAPIPIALRDLIGK